MASTERSESILSSSSSAEKIASHEDLLLEIVVRLPVKSLMKFKSVSKHWLSLITNPNFCRHGYHPGSPCVCGLFLHTWFGASKTYKFHFINLDCQHSNPPFETLTSVDYPPEMRIIQSYNGLLLCSSIMKYPVKYYVCNPTTKQHHMLPPLIPIGEFSRPLLAFDPSKSPYYKVICIRVIEVEETDYAIRIYSSKSGTWRLSEARLNLKLDPEGGVFWNGGFHWYTDSGLCLYFDVDKEEIKEIAMPTLFPDNRVGWIVHYFGESRGHLHLIEMYHPPSTQFDVWEMKNDRSGWSLKYKVNLDGIVSEFPGMIRSYLDPSHLDYYYVFEILCIVEGEREEDGSYMVLDIPTNIILYNLKTRTFKKLCDFPQEDSSDDRHDGSVAPFHRAYAHQYIESLVSI